MIASARDDGPPADAIVTRYFKTRRYAGSKDRRAVRELVFRAIRRSAERPASGRAAMLGLAEDDPELARAVRRAARAGAAQRRAKPARRHGRVPAWLEPELSPLVGADEWPALARARAARPSRQCRADSPRRMCWPSSTGAEPTPLSPWGIRLPADSRVDDHPAFASGLVEVQDEGSQLIALACEPATASEILDLCAGAGGKALALAAAAPGAQILATDTNRARLSQARAARRRARARSIETRLLNPPQRAATSSPTGAARPTSSWSMRRARAAAPGGAIPKGAGG